jgi:hypothetical protein
MTFKMIVKSSGRIIAGVACLLSVAWMSGVGSVCGCPANCSPLACVDVDANCASQTRNNGYDCAFDTCTGIEWFSPGGKQITSTTSENCTCTTQLGTKIGDECFPNPTGSFVGNPFQIPCVVSYTSNPC